MYYWTVVSKLMWHFFRIDDVSIRGDFSSEPYVHSGSQNHRSFIDCEHFLIIINYVYDSHYSLLTLYFNVNSKNSILMS